MSKVDLDAIEARAAKVPSGPWMAEEKRWGAIVSNSDEDIVAEVESLYNSEASVAIAEFVAHAREDVPALIAEVRRVAAGWTEAFDLVIDHGNRAREAEDKVRALTEKLRLLQTEPNTEEPGFVGHA